MGAFFHSESFGAEPPPQRFADKPAMVDSSAWRQRLAEHQHILINTPCHLAFIGDSLTEYWQSTGIIDWDKHFTPLKAINLGIAADRTENILARVNQLDFRRSKIKTVVLMMGTNNLGMSQPDSPQAVFEAIIKVCSAIYRKIPDVRIVVLGIPPSGYEPTTALRKAIKATNTLLHNYSWPEKSLFLPVYDLFVTSDDQWTRGLTTDGTHFSAEGYQRLAELIAVHLNPSS